MPPAHITEEKLSNGWHAVVLSDDRIRAVYVPDVGGKLISLSRVADGLETLSVPRELPRAKPVYGQPFGGSEAYGFDECFPSIAACAYPEEPWHGIPVPDHGELWSIPWQYEIQGDTLHLFTYGVRFPYRFEKWLSLPGDGTLALAYRVTNLSAFPFPCLWSAHPLLAITPNTTLELPGPLTMHLDSSRGSRLGHYLAEQTWPLTADHDGHWVDLREAPKPNTGTADKLYATRVPSGWAVLRDPDRDLHVRFAWQREHIPHLGVWLNGGGWPHHDTPQYNVGLEPCTGWPDRLDVAVLQPGTPQISPHGVAEWTLSISIGTL